MEVFSLKTMLPKSHKKSQKELPQKKSSHCSMGALPDYWGWSGSGSAGLSGEAAARHTLSHATSSQPTAIPTPDDTPLSRPIFVAISGLCLWLLLQLVCFPFTVSLSFEGASNIVGGSETGTAARSEVPCKSYKLQICRNCRNPEKKKLVSLH